MVRGRAAVRRYEEGCGTARTSFCQRNWQDGLNPNTSLLKELMLPNAQSDSNRHIMTQFDAVHLVVFDFDGVFTDNTVTVSQDGVESVSCCRSDGLGLRRLREIGVPALILSTEANPVVSTRARKIGLPCIQGCDDKLQALEEEVSRRGISLKEVAFVGNDINDAACLEHVGLAVVVRDAYPEVAALADIVLERDGGKGAVREFCDLFWRSRQSEGAA
jgi:3-deoxy-D-manno-octulosonate 8-phosphate phosphatase (KDO 8-P phosphatase)